MSASDREAKIPCYAPLFLKKLYHMVCNSDPAIASWSNNGRSFIVKNIPKFATTVIPQYYTHNNFSSLVRQLNLYGFKKVKNPHNQRHQKKWIEFECEDFCRDRPDLLKNICKQKRSPLVENLKEELEELKSQYENLKAECEEIKSQVYDGILGGKNTFTPVVQTDVVTSFSGIGENQQPDWILDSLEDVMDSSQGNELHTNTCQGMDRLLSDGDINMSLISRTSDFSDKSVDPLSFLEPDFVIRDFDNNNNSNDDDEEKDDDEYQRINEERKLAPSTTALLGD